MDIREFVEETLKQVIEGVKAAQESEGGNLINASNNAPVSGHLFSNGTLGTFTIVEFDIAVSAETAGKGGAGLKVFGVGVEGSGEHKSGYANRISFAVPVRLPDGDRSKIEELSATYIGSST